MGNGPTDTTTKRGHEMQHVTATFRNGRVELAELVDWPEGTRVEIRPLVAPSVLTEVFMDTYCETESFSWGKR